MLTLRENNGRCEWSVLRPPQLEERLVMVTQGCPATLVWHRAGGKSMFALEGILYLHDWAKARVEELAAPPTAQPELGFSANGTPRVCSYETPQDGDNDEPETYLVTYDQQADGSWQAIGYDVPPDDGAIEPCTGPLDQDKTGDMRYSPRHLDGSTCAIGNRPADAVCPSRQVLDELSKQIQITHDAIEYVAFAPQSFVAYPIEFGEETTRLAPVFAIEDGTISRIYNRRPPVAQWDVLFSPDYFLVRAEVDMTHATLFKKGSIQPAKEFDDAVRVIWIPGTLPAADVIEVTPPSSGDEDSD